MSNPASGPSLDEQLTLLLTDLLAEGQKQTQHLSDLKAIMQSRLPYGERDGWIAEVRLRRPGGADLGDQSQLQTVGGSRQRSDVAPG